METQASSHHGDPSEFRQRRSKTGYRMEMQNGLEIAYPTPFTQWRSEPVYTTEVRGGSHNQAGSHNGDRS